MLYRDAFQTSVYRMDYPELKDAETYCVDILVPQDGRKQLTTLLRDSLDVYFGWAATWETREMTVWVLSAQPLGITLTKADTLAAYEAGGDHFRSRGATPTQFADYLESYGIAGMPVVDETRLDQSYIFDFSFKPEAPKTFFESLEIMGLQVKKEKRSVEVLVLRAPE